MAVAPATIREAHSNLTTYKKPNNLFQQNKHLVMRMFQEPSRNISHN